MAIQTSPYKTSPISPGRLSLLSSDVEEDPCLIDFDNSQFDFIVRDEFWLLNNDEYDPTTHSYKLASEWIDIFPLKDVDEYFHISNTYVTPTNGHNRFDYLKKSVSGTATITKRKVEPSENGLPYLKPSVSKFGTITKGTIYSNASPLNANRTYEIAKNESEISRSSSDLSTPTSRLSESRAMVNTNTITKNRRSFTIGSRLRPSDTTDCDSVNGSANEQMNSTLEESALSDEISNNNDLKHKLNNTYNKDSDTDTSSTQQSRNYPTISRNITRTLLRREASQGSLNNANQSQKYLSAASNDDLLSSDSSTMSTRSNLSMTSSISGRSEPNLHNSLAVHQIPMNGQVNKFSSRRPQVVSKLVRPSQNGMAKKVSASKLPNSTVNSYGSMNSLPSSNIARTSSQISDVGSDDDQTDQDFSLNSSKLINVLGRKSTFRVHRPTPIVNVAAVFGENGANNFNHQKVKCKSNENIIQCDDMEDFRTKVFNSNSHIRRNVQQVGDPVPNRSDSPSSNSSCSSNSSISRIPNITSRSNGKQSMKSSNLAKGNQVPDNSNFYNNNQTANGATLALINNYNNNNYNASNGKRDSNITNPISTKSTSRIPPALPKNSSSASNRSGIPVCGIAPRSNSYPSEQGVSQPATTLVRKSKLASTYQAQTSTNRFPTISHHNNVNIYNNNNNTYDNYCHTVVGDNSWKNDCF